MKIVVDTRFFLQNNLTGYYSFLKKLFIKTAQTYSDHHFIFLFDRPVDTSIISAPNVMVNSIGPEVKNYLRLRNWFDFKVPRALKKLQADLFISSEALSLRTTIPQILLVSNINPPSSTSILQKFFYEKHFAKARLIVSTSLVLREAIANKSKILSTNIERVSPAAGNNFQPVEWEEREQIKEKYAQGSEYLLFTGGVNPNKNLLNLLKAFSLFKRRQHTSMKLIVTGDLEPDINKTTEKLKTYKFKNDVLVHGFIAQEEFVKVMSGAYALIYPATSESVGFPILEAFRSDVPVIASNTNILKELAESAALFADPTNPEYLAEQLKIIFKDEQLRGELIEKGRVQGEKLTIENSVAQLWNAIQQAISK